MAPLHPTLKGTLLAEGEWDILATDPQSRGVKGNRGADERERNYRPKTKSKPVCKQLFWWEAERGSGLGGGRGTIEIKTFFPGELCVSYHIHILVM